MAKQQAEQQRRAALVDELGDLERRLLPFKLAHKRRTEVLAEIQTWAAEQAGEVAVNYRGERFVANVSARERRRHPVLAKVFAAVGKLKFLAMCSVTLKAIEDTLPLDKREGLIVESLDGPRSVKVLPLEPIEARMQQRQAA